MLSTVVFLSLFVPAAEPKARGDRYFKITVVDGQTGRGVPLVELRTVHGLRFYTDSNGVVAFHEPGLMGQPVFFHVKSHGYEFPRDGFGFRGKALAVKEGGRATLAVKRLNIAERLYRVTGGGIYADSLLVGQRVPLRRPVLNGLVVGCDSVVSTLYRGKLIWFWGDTNRPTYPLGNYHTPGAVSELPGKGGLDPERGVDLEYFVDDKGFARPTAQMPGDGPTWINGLVALPEGKKGERLFAAYAKVKPPLTIYERGLAEFDDSTRQFKKVVRFDANAAAFPRGHPFLHTAGGVKYVYFADPYPLTRVPADLDSLKHLSRYETFTCLKEGSRLADLRVDRYGWKKNTPLVGQTEQGRLVRAGRLKPEDALLHLRDADSGKEVVAHGGSVCWNAYRRRWVLIAVQTFGTSLLGEVWYAEADTPLGPWVHARKVVTHDRCDFYNPKQHPLFDKKNGQVIFFEGTYTHTFSGNPDVTPRYDYNQMMYKLDLSDSRLALPVAVYQHRKDLSLFRVLPRRRGEYRVAFFALDRPIAGTIPICALTNEGSRRLKVGQSPMDDAAALFHALPADVKAAPATTVPLFEVVSADGTRRLYTTVAAPPAGYRRADKPLCRVWRNPMRLDLP